MYWKLFVIFAKIGAFTIGGGVAMIPLIEREVVHKNKWITPEDFLDIISIAPFIIILLVAAVFTTFQNDPTVQAVFKGIRPAVVALIAAPVFRMAVQNRLNWITGGIAVATTVLIAFLRISPIWIIITAIAGGLVMAYSRQDRHNGRKEAGR